MLCHFEGEAPGTERGDGGIDDHEHRRLGVVRPEPRASRQDQIAHDNGNGRAEETRKQREIPGAYRTAHQQADQRANHRPDQQHNQHAC